MVAPCIDDQIHSSHVARRIVGGCPECGYVASDPTMRLHGLGCDLRVECVCGAPANGDELDGCCSDECRALRTRFRREAKDAARIEELYRFARRVVNLARDGQLDAATADEAVRGYRERIRVIRLGSAATEPPAVDEAAQ